MLDEIKAMKEYLKERTDLEVMRGYKEAERDYNEQQSFQIKYALGVISKELKRRKIKLATVDKMTLEEIEEGIKKENE
jgi:alpha-D-ribose 1-methylphosphonate 5-triphosphate diphosphatase PhnM